MSALVVDGVGIAFGGIRALDGVRLSVEPGEILSVIGPNGAGKTTLFNLISGLHRPDTGRVFLAGKDVTGEPPHVLARLGLSRTFQNLEIFGRMSVRENVMVGRHNAERAHALADLFALPSSRRATRASRARVGAVLERFGLGGFADASASGLAYGALKRLEIARALAGEPRVLLLDEPAAGCNPVETEAINRLVRSIADEGVAVVLVEHDMKLVMRLSSRIHVLHHGTTLAEGSPSDVRSSADVIAAYLGTPEG